MVLGSLAFVIGATLLGTQLDEVSALEAAKSFARQVEFGEFESPAVVRHSFILESSKSTASAYVFRFRTATVSVSRGADVRYGYSDHRNGTQFSIENVAQFSPAELLSKAQQFLAQAGFLDDLVLFDTQYEAPSSSQVHFWFLVTHARIPFCDDTAHCRVTLDCVSGRLRFLGNSLLETPVTPAGLSPSTDLITGQSTLRAHIFALNPELECLYDFREIRLGLWVPQAPVGHRVVSGLTPAQIQAGKDNRAMLVYWGTLLNGPTEEESDRSFKVYIDAHTGRLLSYWEGLKSGGFGDGKTRRHAPFAWDVGPATLTLSFGRKSKTVPQARIERVGAKAFSPTQKDLVLTLGRFTFRADYDAKQGLLRHRTPNGATYGRPDPSTRNALATLK